MENLQEMQVQHQQQQRELEQQRQHHKQKDGRPPLLHQRPVSSTSSVKSAERSKSPGAPKSKSPVMSTTATPINIQTQEVQEDYR